MNGPEVAEIFTLVLLFGVLVPWRLHKMAADLSAEFAKLDAAIAALPARIAAAQASAIQPADVQAAADSRAAQVDAILPAAPPPA
jgi:hypothetical protein